MQFKSLGTLGKGKPLQWQKPLYSCKWKFIYYHVLLAQEFTLLLLPRTYISASMSYETASCKSACLLPLINTNTIITCFRLKVVFLCENIWTIQPWSCGMSRMVCNRRPKHNSGACLHSNIFFQQNTQKQIPLARLCLPNKCR